MVARDQVVKSRVVMAVETYGNLSERFNDVKIDAESGRTTSRWCPKTSLMVRRSLVIRCRRRIFEIDHSELLGCPNALRTLDCCS